MRKLDLHGQRFGRLTAVSCTDKKQNGNYMWICVCDCGKEVVVKADHLRRGETKSCGCINIGRQKGIPKKHGFACDENKERLYSVWTAMKTRCGNPKHMYYKNYGGRGIRVCPEWNDYAAFRDWALAHGYDKDAPKGICTLDRIDVDGNYCPENCRWVDMKTQNNNKRRKEG
jgi:hypothetical protein